MREKASMREMSTDRPDITESPYTVDAGRGAVVHHLEMSLNPNWIGVDQVRYFDLQGDRLTLKTPPMVVGGVERVSTLVWERLP
jgi:hypothetical protein